MSKIYTFKARSTVEGFVSIKADTLEQAEKIRADLQGNNRGEINIEVGSGELFIDAVGVEEANENDGNHLMATPYENAETNAAEHEDLLDELEGEEEGRTLSN